MANRNPLIATPTKTVKHPFQIDGLPGPKGPFQMTRIGSRSVGFVLRLDMPGVPRNGFKFFKKPNKVVTFSATAPKNESVPFDESDRVYGGFLQLIGDALATPVQVIAQNGSFLMIFPETQGTLFLMPPPRPVPAQISSGSVKSDKGEGSSSGKSIDEAQAILDKINLDAMNLEGSGKSGLQKISSAECTKAKSEQGGGSSSGNSVQKAEATGSGKSESVNIPSQVSAKEKSKHDEAASEKSRDKPEGSVKSRSVESPSNQTAEGSCDKGSVKSEQSEGPPSGKSIDKAEGSAKVRVSSSSSNEDDEAWMLAYIKRNVLQIHGHELPKEESAPVETFPIEQSSHEVPEIAIGSIKEYGIHDPQCQCQHCDSNGVCLKTWSTTEDVVRYINKLKIKGPDDVCEKRVVQEDGLYSLYVRADLPGLEPQLRVTTVRDRCILVYGKPQPKEHYIRGGRNYLLFVQLRCSCCKFDNLCQDHEDGVLRLLCKIRGPKPGPAAN